MKPRIKTNLILTAVSLILALSLIAAQQVGEPPAVLLERAIQLETVDGDLRAAIELYQRIISQNGNNRAVAAKAFLHLGLCHLKLGNKEAQSAFQKVIDDYSDQSETAKQAREQLSMLLRTQTQLAKGREMNIRRIYDGTGPEWGNALSSAGRHLVYTDWETGDMAVVDLTTREHRRLTSTGGLRSPSGDMGETSIFSPDDKRIAYGWMIGNKFAELRAVNFDGTDPKLLLRDETAIWIRPHDWSSDGKNILIALMRKDNSSDIALFSLPENKANIIRHVSAKDPEMRFSPDGRSVLLIGSRGEGLGIYRIEIPGGEQTLLVRVPPRQFSFRAVWAPDGKSIFYHVGNPVRILRHDIDANRDIELVKTSMNGLSEISLSPDGKWLAFTSRQALGSLTRVSLVSPAGGPIREIFTTNPGEIVQWLQWTPDGRSIWLRKYIPAADAKMKPKFEFLSISPDGQRIRKLDQSLIATGINRFHPGGRQLAFSFGQSRIELWALENFLQPVLK